MGYDSSDLVEVPADLVHETDRAWLVNVGGLQNVWVPKSVATYDAEMKCLSLARWQAEDRGLV